MTANDPVVQSSLPLEVVAHNATVIVSGVLLGALLAWITFHLGWLRHHVRLNDRLVNVLFPLGPEFFFFTLPLWFIVTLPSAVRFSALEYNLVLESTVNIPPQMTETPT
ncbi:hypothetical protein N7455_002683 [Penicillium solitum]|uniref:uncharacterized protein n=1 Tax=Penicillium solitum TaxID=60172 RepID=UPI00181CCCAA|nr:hypothetical protein HAV15_006250 [Penicillium sp. str. \